MYIVFDNYEMHEPVYETGFTWKHFRTIEEATKEFEKLVNGYYRSYDYEGIEFKEYCDLYRDDDIEDSDSYRVFSYFNNDNYNKYCIVLEQVKCEEELQNVI